MKNSKRKKLQQMEYEDSVGIKRGKGAKPLFTLRSLGIIRIVLTAAAPIVYFLCSPFLIVIAVLWASLLVITLSVEKKYNAGLKSDSRTKLPKTDCVLSIIFIVIVVISVIVTSLSRGSKRGIFDGMQEGEMAGAIATKFDYSKMAIRQAISKLKDFGSLMTGTRWLFQSERAFGHGFGGGGGGAHGDFAPPVGKPDMGKMLSDMPFSMVFESVMKAVCTAFLLLICVIAIFSIFKLKKIRKLDLSPKELAKMRAKQEEKIKKKNADKRYIAMEKADYEKMERELLDDLDFLFETEELDE